MGDPKGKKQKSKKSNWQQEHKCKNCKEMTSMFICHLCGKVSV
jgi:hypothetical protein